MSDSEGLIRERAYLLWEEAGCPEGRSEDFWFRARDEVEGETPSGDVPEGTQAPLGEDPPSFAVRFGVATGMPGERIAEQGVLEDSRVRELAMPVLADEQDD